ncbi:MAG TPA: MmgE/PrpD family protein [Corynebacteriales bacterium]|nr:MmgE/PrpD family protein [Mycobacteriales bacterium]
MKHNSKQLLAFLAGVQWADIPHEVSHQAKRCIVDYMAAVLAGSQTNEARKAYRGIQDTHLGSQASGIGFDGKLSCLGAAFMNGLSGHALEVDDGNRFAMGHPGVVVIPAVLSIGEWRNLSGRELLLSIIVGYEVFGRVARAVSPNHFDKGFHPTGTCGTFAAAIACSKLLGHSKLLMEQCLGLAGSMSSGLFEFLSDGSNAKLLNVADAAQSGIQAAFLADAGLTGPPSILEGPRGFFQAVSNTVNPEILTEGLGLQYQIMDTYVKMHACCRHLHTTIDSMIKLRSENSFALEDIDSIVVHTYEAAAKLNNKDIGTPLAGRMSIPYCAAVALIEGKVSCDQFNTATILDETVRKLVQKVEVRFDRELQKYVPQERPARVIIALKNGKEYSTETRLPYGEKENPVSDIDLNGKFESLAGNLCSHKSAQALLETLWNLEAVGNIADLMKMCQQALAEQ